MNFPSFRHLARSFFLASAGLMLVIPAARSDVELPLAVQIIGEGSVKPDYNGQVLTDGAKYSMTAKPGKGFKFASWSGDATSTKPKLTFTNSPGLSFTATFVDKQRPTVTIYSVPNSGALVTNILYTSGTARDNDAVTNVLCRIISGGVTNGWQNAGTYNGWSNWWLSVTLAPGTNWLEACAVDASGLVSKTNRLKLIHTVTPATLANFTATVTDPENGDEIVEVLDFGADTFTGITGAGGYSYKKTSSINAQVKLSWAAPPSAEGDPGKVLLQFASATEGTLTDADGAVYDFTLDEAGDWAPATLHGADLVLAYDDGTNQVVLRFSEPPTVDTNEIPVLQNPYTIPLESDYPGQPGDRVNVTFLHERYVGSAGTWVQYPPKVFIGNVIDLGDATVTVLFDTPPKNGDGDEFILDAAPLDILTCGYDTPATNDTALFAYIASSPAGAVLLLNQGGADKYLILNFTSEDTEGTFYEEDYFDNAAPVMSTGTFAIALPPSIVTLPVSLAVTNGGTASFTVVAQGTAPLAYQWQFNSNNLADGPTGWGSTIAGSATTNLVITGVTSNDLGSYRVVVTNQFGSDTSSAATLALQLPPEITVQPATLIVTNGTNAAFTVTATGSAPLAYQWQFLGSAPANAGTNLVNSGNISGVTSNTLAFKPAYTNHIGFYQVIITNLYGAVTSSAPYLDVILP
jgi:hypothetical protein